ncbi:MAG: CocE/NonD family hydrolase [Paracoccaceae bacterium]
MPIQTISENPDIGITMSDGIRLSARVWMPENAVQKPVPAILEFLPYRKRDGTCARDEITHPHFAAHGYACLRVDIRGNGDSDGIMTDEYSQQELADAVEVINWIAAQDWCDGNVGMMGISWGGFNALQVAALQPKPLKAIITLCSTVDRFADDIHYKGGCMLNRNLGWAATMLSYSSRAPDPEIVGEKWREMWLERLEAEPHLTELWASHQHRDAYWKHGSVCEDYSKIKAATLAIGGWNDAYKNAIQLLVENLQAPVKGIIGPWIHKYPHIAAPEPRIDFLGEALRWWEHWLKGIDTGVEEDADLRLFLMESEAPKSWYPTRKGRWIDQDFRNAPIRTFHLSANGLQNDPTEFAAIVDSPADTGMSSGEYCAIWKGPDLPGDQRRDDACSTLFETQSLNEGLAIIGAVEVTLELASDTPVAQISVRLNDVHPNGKVSRITYGVLNLTHRDSAEFPAKLPEGKSVRVSLKLDQIAYDLPKGHKLRLSISNAYWPLMWPAPQAGKLIITAGNVKLPLLNEGGKPVVFAKPEPVEGWQINTMRPVSNARRTVLDQHSGITTLEMVDDFGEIEDLNHGLINGSIARESWHIHPDDPNSATTHIHWSDTLRRGNWSVRTETNSWMRSDAENFYISAKIEAFEGDDLIFEQEFDKTLPRDLV